MNTFALPVGILLAAGRGRRFDPAGIRNKLLARLPASDIAVVAASAAVLTDVLARVIAVVRPGDDDVAALLRAAGCEVVVCPDADEGMAASLAQALRSAARPSDPSHAGCIVALADMPYIQASTVQALADALAAGASIAAPVYQGRRGNPVGFAGALLPELLALQGDAGARGLFARHAWTAVAVNDPGVLRDIDTPADLS